MKFQNGAALFGVSKHAELNITKQYRFFSLVTEHKNNCEWII